MKRFKHSLSHYRLFSCDLAELIPVSCYEVLPGDSFQQASSALIRVSPLLAPVMHPISVRIHHWFVPNRLLWDDWEPFITGGEDGEGDGSSYPTITGNFAAGALGDYLGVPPGVANTQVSALPFRAYNLIFNEFYRDQDLTSERAMVTTGGADATTAVTLAKCAWEKDYFTSARPWPQKGPDVTIPLGGQADVVSNANAIKMKGAVEGVDRNVNVNVADDKLSLFGFAGAGDEQVIWGTETGLTADMTTGAELDVRTLRTQMAIQRYREARAQYGSRYSEYLRFLGVRSSDARLQRPEYLGGGKQVISFTEVLQTGVTTSGTPNLGVGELKGHGIAAMRSRRFRRFFEEHGYVISLMSCRPKTMYTTGLHKGFSRSTKEDYWQKELEMIGQQEVYNREVYTADSAPGDVFGYQDRYAEYRHHPSGVAGEFRSTLNYWHLARIFAADVTLNNSFVECDPSKRIHAVQTNDVLWVMVNNSIQGRRMVRRATGIGRIV